MFIHICLHEFREFLSIINHESFYSIRLNGFMYKIHLFHGL